MPQTGFDLLVSFLTNDITVWTEDLNKKNVKYNRKAQLYLILAAMDPMIRCLMAEKQDGDNNLTPPEAKFQAQVVSAQKSWMLDYKFKWLVSD